MLRNEPFLDLQARGIAQLATPADNMEAIETLNISGNQIYGLDFLTRLPNLKMLIANNIPQQRVPPVKIDEVETNVILQFAKPPRVLHFTQNLPPMKVLTCFFAEFKVAARSKVTTGLLKFHFQDGVFLGKRATPAPVYNCQIQIYYIQYENYHFTTLETDEADLKQFAHGYTVKHLNARQPLFVCIRSNSGDGIFAFSAGAFLEEAEITALCRRDTAAPAEQQFLGTQAAHTALMNTVNTLSNAEVSMIQATDRKRKIVNRLAQQHIAVQRDALQVLEVKVGQSIENAQVYVTLCKSPEFIDTIHDALGISEIHAESLLLQLKAADFSDHELKIAFQGREFVAPMEREKNPFRDEQVGHLCFAVTAEDVRVLLITNSAPNFALEKFEQDDEVTQFKVSVEHGVCFIYHNGTLHSEISSGAREVSVTGGMWRVVFVQNGVIEVEEEIIG